MRDDAQIALQIGEATIYADTITDLAHALTRIEAEKLGERMALQHDLEAKRRRIDELTADLKDLREVAVYGPELREAKEQAFAARDRALEENEQLRQTLEKERLSRADLDKTRRALASELRMVVDHRTALREENTQLAANLARTTKALKAKQKGARKR